MSADGRNRISVSLGCGFAALLAAVFLFAVFYWFILPPFCWLADIVCGQRDSGTGNNAAADSVILQQEAASGFPNGNIFITELPPPPAPPQPPKIPVQLSTGD